LSRTHPRQGGIALLLVLWVLTLLTIIAVGLTATQRTESALARSQLASARFHAAAEAGISWTILNLLAPASAFDEEAEAWVPDAEARPWSFGGQYLEIRVFNEASRIDLNRASRDLLESLLKAVEVPEDEASAIADAIEDWRDTNDLKQLNGAEDDDYEDAGRPYGAKDAPFDSVDELQLVLGVDRDLYRALAPALTVDSGREVPDKEFASLLVQAALDGTTLAEEQLKEEEQESLIVSGDFEVSAVDRGGPLYRIRVTEVPEEGKPGPTMEALVQIADQETPPYSILWRRLAVLAEDPVSVAGDEGEGTGGL